MHESFGSRLRHERERRKIELNSIADETKISIALLQGLERDDVKRWPSGIFRKSFMKSYAAAIGLDPETIVKEFLETYPDPLEPLPVAPETAPPPAPTRRARVAALASSIRMRVSTRTRAGITSIGAGLPSVGGAFSAHRTAARGSVSPSVSAPASASVPDVASASAPTSVAARAGTSAKPSVSVAASIPTFVSASGDVVPAFASVATPAFVSTPASVPSSASIPTSAPASGTRVAAGARIPARSSRPKALPGRVSTIVRQTKALPGRLSAAVRQLPPVSVKFTIISTGATFAKGSFLDGMRTRFAAAACDVGISCVLALLLFIGVGSFWTPLGVSMVCYYVGGIVILGNTPGVCLFAPVSRDGGRSPTKVARQ